MNALEHVKDQHILDLTLYEAGNTLWKLSSVQKKLSVEEADSLLGTIARLIVYMKITSVSDIDLSSVMNTARDERATFYDAAYIETSKSRKYLLITDDKRLARIAAKYVGVKSSSEL